MKGYLLWITASLLGPTRIALSRNEQHCQAINKHQRTKIYKRQTTPVALAIPATKLLHKRWYIADQIWWRHFSKGNQPLDSLNTFWCYRAISTILFVMGTWRVPFFFCFYSIFFNFFYIFKQYWTEHPSHQFLEISLKAPLCTLWKGYCWANGTCISEALHVLDKLTVYTETKVCYC